MTARSVFQALAVVLVVSGIVYGFLKWRDNVVISDFEHMLKTSAPPTNAAEYASRITNSIPIVCMLSDSSFSESAQAVAYFAGGKARVDVTYLSAHNETEHQIKSADGAYIWNDKEDVVHYYSPQTPFQNDGAGQVFSSISCKRWKENPVAFEPPVDREIQDDSDAR